MSCEVDDDAVGIHGYQVVTFTATYFGGTNGSSSRDGEARCPIGMYVIGGGVDSGCAGGYVRASHPRNLTPTSGWWGSVGKPNEYTCGENPATMTVYAICANVN